MNTKSTIDTASSGISSAEKIVSLFISSFSNADYDQMNELLAENVVSYITNAEASVNKLQGRSAFMGSIPCDVTNVKPQVRITQLLTVKHNQVLVMVEVKAERKGKKLHNHAAYLINVENGKISEIWMVEALPAYSDEFWKS